MAAPPGAAAPPPAPQVHDGCDSPATCLEDLGAELLVNVCRRLPRGSLAALRLAGSRALEAAARASVAAYMLTPYVFEYVKDPPQPARRAAAAASAPAPGQAPAAPRAADANDHPLTRLPRLERLTLALWNAFESGTEADVALPRLLKLMGGVLPSVETMHAPGLRVTAPMVAAVVGRLPRLRRVQLWLHGRGDGGTGNGAGGSDSTAATGALGEMSAVARALVESPAAPRLEAVSLAGAPLTAGAAEALSLLPRLRALHLTGTCEPWEMAPRGWAPNPREPYSPEAAAAFQSLTARSRLRSLAIPALPRLPPEALQLARLRELVGVDLPFDRVGELAAGLPQLTLLVARPTGKWGPTGAAFPGVVAAGGVGAALLASAPFRSPSAWPLLQCTV
jgi:hypothetical protein